MAFFALRGSLRVANGLTFAPDQQDVASARQDRTAMSDIGGPDPKYMDALAKLFPAEGVTLAPMVPTIAGSSMLLKIVLVLAIVVLIVLLRRVATQPDNGGKTDWIAVAVSVISFILYVFTLQVFGSFFGDKPEEVQQHTLLMTFITVIWVAAVPLIPKRK